MAASQSGHFFFRHNEEESHDGRDDPIVPVTAKAKARVLDVLNTAIRNSTAIRSSKFTQGQLDLSLLGFRGPADLHTRQKTELDTCCVSEKAPLITA